MQRAIVPPTSALAWSNAVVWLLVALWASRTPSVWSYSVVPWLFGLGSLLHALRVWDRQRPATAAVGVSEEPWTGNEIILVTLLLAVALFLRVYRLAEFPMRLYDDDGAVGLQAMTFLGPTPPSPFSISGWYAIPNFQIYLVSFGLRVTGDQLFGLRLGNAVIGWLSLPGGYLLTRFLLGPRIAVLTLALAIPFHWHLFFSRTGPTYISAATTTAWALFAFAKGLRTGRRLWLCLAGIFLSTGLMVYWSARATPVVFALWWLAWVAVDRPGRKRAAAAVLFVLLGAAAAFSPMALHYIANGYTHLAFARESTIAIWSTDDSNLMTIQRSGASLQYLKRQFVSSFGIFCCSSVTDGRLPTIGTYVSGLMTPFFVGGILLSLRQLPHLGWIFLWLWFLTTVVLGSVIVIQPPNGYHTLPIASVVLVFAASALAYPFELTRLGKTARKGLAATVAVLVLAFGWREVSRLYKAVSNPIALNGFDITLSLLRRYPEVRRTINVSAGELPLSNFHYRFIAPGADSARVSETDNSLEKVLEAIRSSPKPVLVIAESDGNVAPWLGSRGTLLHTAGGEKKLSWFLYR